MRNALACCRRPGVTTAVQYYEHGYASTKRRRNDNTLDEWKDNYDDDDDNDRQDDVDRYVAMRLTAEQTNSYS